MMKSPVWMMLSGAAALVIGAGLYFLAVMEADLRFAACTGYFRLDAAEPYCRSVGHIAIAGIGLGASGLTLLGVSCVVAWARSEEAAALGGGSGETPRKGGCHRGAGAETRRDPLCALA